MYYVIRCHPSLCSSALCRGTIDCGSLIPSTWFLSSHLFVLANRQNPEALGGRFSLSLASNQPVKPCHPGGPSGQQTFFLRVIFFIYPPSRKVIFQQLTFIQDDQSLKGDGGIILHKIFETFKL